MIPKVIHYCWFGRNPLPESAIKCINSWKKFFPDYEIKEWNEDNFDINIIPYTKEAYEEYQVAINNHNRQLRRLSKMLPAGCKLTSYTSRHSWATAARNHNVPISVISQGMGHTSEQTTQIYLTMLENSVIDGASQVLIRSLLE